MWEVSCGHSQGGGVDAVSWVHRRQVSVWGRRGWGGWGVFVTPGSAGMEDGECAPQPRRGAR